MPPPAAMCSKRPLSADSGKPPSTCLPQLARRPKGMAGLFVLGMIALQRPGIGKCSPGHRALTAKASKTPCFQGAQPISTRAERWPSGRRRTPAKGVGGEPSRGFESLPLRQPIPTFSLPVISRTILPLFPRLAEPCRVKRLRCGANICRFARFALFATFGVSVFPVYRESTGKNKNLGRFLGKIPLISGVFSAG